MPKGDKVDRLWVGVALGTAYWLGFITCGAIMPISKPNTHDVTHTMLQEEVECRNQLAAAKEATRDLILKLCTF